MAIGTLHVTAEPGKGTVLRMRFAPSPDGSGDGKASEPAKIAS